MPQLSRTLQRFEVEIEISNDDQTEMATTAGIIRDALGAHFVQLAREQGTIPWPLGWRVTPRGEEVAGLRLPRLKQGG